MVNKLESFLDRIGDNLTENWYGVRDVQEWMLEEVFRKFSSFPRWRKKVLFSWTMFKKSTNHKYNSESKPSNGLSYFPEFMEQKFHEFYTFFLEKMYPFHANRLEIVKVSKKNSDYDSRDLFLEYKYHFNHDEVEAFQSFRKKYNHHESHQKIITYIFNIIVLTFRKMICDIVDNKIQIRMLAGRIKSDKNSETPNDILQELKSKNPQDSHKSVHFLISVNIMDTEFLKLYLKSEIFHFAEKVAQTPKHVLERLRVEKNKLFPLALQKYPRADRNAELVLYTLAYKSKIIRDMTPLLDITNFICSRVEDSIFETENAVKKIVAKDITEDPDVQADILKIFNYLNQKASLFSTFQSNNRANKQEQYQLFFFYIQYFCSNGLEYENNERLFFPHIFKETLNNTEIVAKDENDYYYSVFSGFIFQGLMLLDKEGFDTLFEALFRDTIFHVNENFFDSFLYSFNVKFKNIINECKENNENFTYGFNEIVDIIAHILVEFVKNVFIADTPENATDNFHDNISRYTPERLALRVLELKIFKDIPLSDNNWQDYFLSRNRKYVEKIFEPFFNIPDGYFFPEERLLKINMIYERGALNNAKFLEEWLIQDVIRPFYKFQEKIREKLSDDYTKSDLAELIFTESSQSIIDPYLRDKMEDLAMFIAQFV